MQSDETVEDWPTLYVIVRDRRGRIAHRAIGRAVVMAEGDASLTMLALRKKILPVSAFLGSSPAGAAAEMGELADLGDVDFDERDFDPRWFPPNEGIEAVDGLLGHRTRGNRRLSPDVQGELELLRRTLHEARRRSCTFYLVEVEPGEDLGFAGPELAPSGCNREQAPRRPTHARHPRPPPKRKGFRPRKYGLVI